MKRYFVKNKITKKLLEKLVFDPEDPMCPICYYPMSLNDGCEWSENPIDNVCSYCLGDVISFLMKELYKKRDSIKWISIKNKLPIVPLSFKYILKDDYFPVLVAIKRKYKETLPEFLWDRGMYKNGKFYYEYENIEIKNVTHWAYIREMELPKQNRNKN